MTEEARGGLDGNHTALYAMTPEITALHGYAGGTLDAIPRRSQG